MSAGDVPEMGDASEARVTFLHVASLILIGCAVYANTFTVPFVFDDRAAISTNLRIRELWPAPFSAARPIVELTLALNYALGGLDVRGYHALNLVLHLGCALLLLDLARRTLLLTATLPERAATTAWLAAALFVVHPLQTEAVTYVISRSEVLMVLCYLATLELIVLGEQHPRSRLWLWCGAVAACALGMATKPVMVTAPLAALWLAQCILDAPVGPRAGASAPGAEDAPPVRRWPLHLGLMSTWLVLAYLLQFRDQPGAGLDIGITPLAYLRTQLGVTWHYLTLLVWPVGQSLDYDWPLATRWLDPTVIVPALAWVTILALLFHLVRRRHRAAAFWLGLALLALLPSSSVVPIADLVFEHRMYLSVGCFAVLIALAAGGAAARFPRVLAVSAVALLIALGIATVRRNETWRDPVTLWEDALSKAPGKPRIMRSLLATYEERGDRTNAERIARLEMRALERQREARPHDPQILAALADAHARRGDTDVAMGLLTEAAKLAPEDELIRAAYGSILLRVGRAEDAIENLEIAEELAQVRGDWPGRDALLTIRTNLGWAYATVGRDADAVRVLQQAAAGDNVATLNNLGSILGRLGRWEEARAVLDRAHMREPTDPNILSNLGWVYANLGRLRDANALLEQAIVLQPTEPSAHGNLGWVRLRAGDPAGALHALSMALALQPANAWVANMKGIAHARLTEWDAAVAAFERAVSLDPESSIARENRTRALKREQPLFPEPSP